MSKQIVEIMPENIVTQINKKIKYGKVAVTIMQYFKDVEIPKKHENFVDELLNDDNDYGKFVEWYKKTYKKAPSDAVKKIMKQKVYSLLNTILYLIEKDRNQFGGMFNNENNENNEDLTSFNPNQLDTRTETSRFAKLKKIWNVLKTMFLKHPVEITLSVCVFVWRFIILMNAFSKVYNTLNTPVHIDLTVNELKESSVTSRALIDPRNPPIENELVLFEHTITIDQPDQITMWNYITDFDESISKGKLFLISQAQQKMEDVIKNIPKIGEKELKKINKRVIKKLYKRWGWTNANGETTASGKQQIEKFEESSTYKKLLMLNQKFKNDNTLVQKISKMNFAIFRPVRQTRILASHVAKAFKRSWRDHRRERTRDFEDLHQNFLDSLDDMVEDTFNDVEITFHELYDGFWWTIGIISVYSAFMAGVNTPTPRESSNRSSRLLDRIDTSPEMMIAQERAERLSSLRSTPTTLTRSTSEPTYRTGGSNKKKKRKKTRRKRKTTRRKKRKTTRRKRKKTRRKRKTTRRKRKTTRRRRVRNQIGCSKRKKTRKTR
jgi:hypothetical protein